MEVSKECLVHVGVAPRPRVRRVWAECGPRVGRGSAESLSCTVTEHNTHSSVQCILPSTLHFTHSYLDT